jgi:NAD(P)-dependent dehydrogenase (short-subunit alcohol dehydrogenase family)
MNASPKRAIVVGASRGIGAACVRELVARGYQVGAVARSSTELHALSQEASLAGKVHTRVHDVKDREDIPRAFHEMVEQLGGLDMIVYATGIMPKITPETYDTKSDWELLQVNLLGCVGWFNEAAVLFKSQKRGRIVGISSIAGDRGRRGYPAYNTSKAAMNTYLEALLNRLARDGVTVTTIKPGYVATAMTEGMQKLFWVAQPEQAASQIIQAGEAGVRSRYVLRRWWLIAQVIKSIPSVIFRRLDI